MRRRLERVLVNALEAHLQGQRAGIPTYAAPLWHAFNALSRTRGLTEFGPGAITYQEIAAYRDLMGVPLEPHHVAIIVAMDAAWIRHVNALRESGARPLGKVSQVPISGDAFDAMFG